jgi:hypothetical protein
MKWVVAAAFGCCDYKLLPSGAQSCLSDDGVITLANEKFDDATITRMIQRHSTNFDLSVDAIVRLRQAGISEKVLQAMLAAAPDGKTVLPAGEAVFAKPVHLITASDVPDEIGVYVSLREKLVAIEPEVVNWQTGGVLKELATSGLFSRSAEINILGCGTV